MNRFNTTWRYWLIGLTCLAAQSACAQQTPPTEPAPPPTATPETAVPAVPSLNPFGLAALKTQLTENPNNSVLLSPFSLGTALSLLAQGAKGDTAAAFAQTLGYPVAQSASFATTLADLGKTLSREGDSLTVGWSNGLWLATDFTVQPEFTELAKNSFQAAVEQVDFSQAATVQTINAWFKEKTKDLIPQLFAELPADTRFVLGNALYFKGRWQLPFDAALTQEQPFHTGPEQSHPVAMMQHNNVHFDYRETEQFQAVRLPFADREFDLLVVLPKSGQNPAELLTEAVIDGAEMLEHPGQLRLPRMALDLGGDARPWLAHLGLEPVLSGQSDFSGLTEEPLTIGPIVHRVTFSIDETGAEAAAATAVVGLRSALIIEPFTMTVDRPFLVALRHVPSNTVLFLGWIVDPQPQ